MHKILLLSLPLLPVLAQSSDPFARPQLDCQTLEQRYYQIISGWHFVGWLDFKAQATQIWLIDKQHRVLTFSEQQIPAILAPWQLVSLHNKQLSWQANLPAHCDNQLTYNMLLSGVGNE